MASWHSAAPTATRLFQELAQHGARYLVIGGHALREKSTVSSEKASSEPELYLWIGPDPENAWRIRKAIDSIESSRPPGTLPHKIPRRDLDKKTLEIGTPPLLVHFLEEIQDLSFLEAYEHRLITHFKNIEINLINLDLIQGDTPDNTPSTPKIWYQEKPVRKTVLIEKLSHFYENWKYSYFTLMGSIALLPILYFIHSKGPRAALVISGLHFFLIAYVFDFLQVSIKKNLPTDNQTARPLHVFIVAWLLPFVLTVSPALQHLRSELFFLQLLDDAPILQEAGKTLPTGEVLDKTELRISQGRVTAKEFEEIFNRGFVAILLHTLLFSSLVVLVPLEFFALFFLRDYLGVDRRHVLIAAGCLDIATLFFLLLIAKQEVLVQISDPSARRLTLAYFVLVWVASFISSFQAIYAAQYSEDDADTNRYLSSNPVPHPQTKV